MASLLGWLPNRRRSVTDSPSISLLGPSEPPHEESLAEHLSIYQQGDVIKVPAVPLINRQGLVEWRQTPLGAAVISQTCDIVLTDREGVTVAPVTRQTGNNARLARGGRMPNLVHLPELGEEYFADLSISATLDKHCFVTWPPTHGVKTSLDIRRFGQRVGRRFSRFAFPDEIIPWLRPLQDVVSDKYGKDASPIAWAAEQVESFRLQCLSEWTSGPPYDLTFWVIMKSDIYPTYPSDVVPDMPNSVKNVVERRDLAKIAEKLKNGVNDPAERYWLWGGFADACEARCRPPLGATDFIKTAVRDGAFQVGIADASEFRFDQYLNSEDIDLDHLSAPAPR